MTHPDAPDKQVRPVYRRIKDLRNFFSLSENGLRLYEKAGLCTPTRDEQNGYRVCSLSDAVLMCNAYDYTRFGFTLRDTASILREGSLEDQIAALRERNAAYYEALFEMMAKKRRLEEEIVALDAYLHDPRQCVIVRTRLLNLPIHDQNMEMGAGNDDSAAWWSAAPLVSAGLCVELDDALDAIENIWHGPIAEEADASRRQLPLDHAIEFCSPSQPCLQSYATFPVEEFPTEQTYAHLKTYLDENGLMAAENRIYHRLLRWIRNENDVPWRIDVVYLPLVAETLS